MTGQGGDILAFLDCVLTEQERALTPLVGLGTCPDWGHCQPECTHQFGINDSEAKLRRCAAERKILALHNVPSQVYPDSGERSDDRRCVGCGFNSHEEPMVDDVRDCPTLNALAEGYGWTGGER